MADEIKEVKFTDSTTDLSEGESNATLGEKAWYVVNTYSTHENKVKVNLQRRVESMGLQDLIFRIIVAEQEVPVMKDGMPTDKTRMKNLYPGYVFVEMIMTDYAWYVVRNTRGVTGFVGPGSEPVPLTDAEMIRLGVRTTDIEIDVEVGDSIKVIAGAWEGTVGNIKTISKTKQSVTIDIDIFGRSTDVEISLGDIQKL